MYGHPTPAGCSCAVRSRTPNHARPFEPSIKSQFWKISSTFGDKCPENGSKNGLRAPRTGLGYPLEGPFVVQSSGWPEAGPGRYLRSRGGNSRAKRGQLKSQERTT